MSAVDVSPRAVTRLNGSDVAGQSSMVLGRDAVAKNLLSRLFAILERFPGATELVLNRPGRVMVEHGAQWSTVDDESLTFDWVLGLATALGRFSSQQINSSKPIMSTPLPGGERLQIVIPPASEPGIALLTLRIPAPTIRTLDSYNRDGYFDRFGWGFDEGKFESRKSELEATDTDLVDLLMRRDLMGFFTRAVEAQKNIAIVGATGSGKTTLMKTLCQLIPSDERLGTIEDVRELYLPAHDNRFHMLYSKGGQGQANVTPADLIASCMRQRPDRVLLAELRGSEAYDFLDLLTTGHSGSITSFHAESCALAYERYAMMAKKHPDAAVFELKDLRRLVELTIDVIVHVVSVKVRNASGEWEKARFIKQVHFDPLAKLDAEIGRGATMHQGPRA